MAVAVYADVVSSLSGALTKINKKSPHAVDQKMVLATHRQAPTTQVGKCNRMYLRGLNSVTRSTPVSADEVEHRTKFSAVSAAVNARLKDSSKQAADLAAFNVSTRRRTRLVVRRLCAPIFGAWSRRLTTKPTANRRPKP